MRKILVLFTAAVLTLVSAVSAGAAAPHRAVSSHFFEAVQMPDEALAALKASGKPLPFSNFPHNDRAQGVPFKGRSMVDSYSLLAGPAGAEQRILAILVEFQDDPPGGPHDRVEPQQFDQLIAGTSYDPYSQATLDTYAAQGHPVPTDRTVNSFYRENSFGVVSVTTPIKPSDIAWVKVDHPYSYYSQWDGVHDNGFGPYPHNAQGLVIDALSKAYEVLQAQGKDFSVYAGADGKVPNVFIIHAGSGAEWSGTPELIWSHAWALSDDPMWGARGSTFTIGGATFDHYSMEPEVGGDLTAYLGAVSGPFPATVGVYAHEFGHVLGLPDIYDIFYGSEGAGNYSLMSGGSWLRYPNAVLFNGNSPAHLDAWSKMQMGFLKEGVNLETILGPGHYKLYPAATGNEPGQIKAYRYNVPGSRGTEYFLLENRQQVGFDQGFARNGAPAGIYSQSHGLLVWHIDDNLNAATDISSTSAINNEPNVSPKWSENMFNNGFTGPNGWDHYAVGVVQADGKFELERGYNRGNPGDFFPGTTGNRSLTLTTTPNTSSYYMLSGMAIPGESGLMVTNVQENADGTVEFDVDIATK